MSVDHLTDYERETVININDAETVARVWTAQRRYITQLRSLRDAREVRSGWEGTTEWAEFEIPVRCLRFRNPPRLTDDQRAASAERLRALRENRQ